ncbi:MAG: ubiquinone biosynthesis monooxygenase Coq7, partial [Hyphomonadaceae bacterium]
FFGRIQLQKLREYESHEKEHREIFAKYLEIHGIRKCISYHLCGIGGLALGLITGLLGKQTIAATTFAVENVVVKHLQGQLIYLTGNDAVAAECVSRIINDENTHLSESESEFNAEKLLNRIAIAVVSFCTEAIIKFGMR